MTPAVTVVSGGFSFTFSTFTVSTLTGEMNDWEENMRLKNKKNITTHCNNLNFRHHSLKRFI